MASASLLQMLAQGGTGGPSILDQYNQGQERGLRLDDMLGQRESRQFIPGALNDDPGALAKLLYGNPELGVQIAQRNEARADRQEDRAFRRDESGRAQKNSDRAYQLDVQQFGQTQANQNWQRRMEEERIGIERDKVKANADLLKSGLFAGKGATVQGLNYLVSTGQLTPEQAANIAAGRYVAGPDGALSFATPAQVIGAPGGDGGAMPGPVGGKATTTDTPGLRVIQPGAPKPTESQIKGQSILQGAEGSFDPAMKNFDELAKFGNSAAGSLPYGAGRPFQSGKAQVGTDALRNVTANYIYALSGQQAPETEVQRQMNLLIPSPLDKPEAIIAKKARLTDMINTIRARAQGPGNLPPVTGEGQNAPAGENDPLGIR